MMKPEYPLFQPALEGRESWAALFQSIEAFAPLIEAIYAENGLAFADIRNLTPGTNAVFLVGDTVIKIFAPPESGFATYEDYFIELAALRHANCAGVAAPRLLCEGFVEDRYLFRYIVMEYIEGDEAEHCLSGCANDRKRAFANQLKTITTELNIENHDRNIPVLHLNDILDNQRWSEFPDSFRTDRIAFLRDIEFPKPVYTHGDLTGENIIIDKNGDVFVIDFADSRIAPQYYEWPPLVFALFGCDPVMMEAYFGGYRNDEFIELLTRGLLIHDFGAGILLQMCQNAAVPKDAIKDLATLRDFVRKCVESGTMKVK